LGNRTHISLHRAEDSCNRLDNSASYSRCQTKVQNYRDTVVNTLDSTLLPADIAEIAGKEAQDTVRYCSLCNRIPRGRDPDEDINTRLGNSDGYSRCHEKVSNYRDTSADTSDSTLPQEDIAGMVSRGVFHKIRQCSPVAQRQEREKRNQE
jgi:hypothetical protein